jgi:hypothetical protein
MRLKYYQAEAMNHMNLKVILLHQSKIILRLTIGTPILNNYLRMVMYNPRGLIIDLERLMSACDKLSNFYGSFFLECCKVAVKPYTLTFSAIYNSDEDKFASAAIAVAACISLTFVVPILPAACSFTFLFASIAMLLSTASMLLTYPVAAIIDGVTAACAGSTQSAPPYDYA